jgi:hypothetical protein
MDPVGCGHTNPLWVESAFCLRLLTELAILVGRTLSV